MKILVTGATGFVGRALIKQLSGKHDIYGLTRKKNITLDHESQFQSLFVDWNRNDTIDAAVSGKDIVFHFAGEMFGRFWHDFYVGNVLNTKRIFEACLHRNVKAFVYLSSISAGGPSKAHRILDETIPPEPNGLYGKSKLLAEKELQKMGRGSNIKVYIIRAPLIYGPGQSKYFSHFLSKILSGHISVVGNARCVRSLCFIDNLVNFFDLLLTKHTHIGGLFYVSDQEIITVDELIHLVGEIANVPVKKNCLPNYIATFCDRLYFILSLLQINLVSLFVLRSSCQNISCTIEKAKADLNYQPRYTMREGLKITIDWFRKQK